MTTSTIELSGMLSPLSVRGVENQLAQLPRVCGVNVNYAAGATTVEYDERVTDLNALTTAVRECGFHCRGELLPKHICTSDGEGHAGHAVPPVPVSHPIEHADHAGHGPAPARPAAVQAHAMHEMAHEMGHSAGMDMREMARDKRNRFWSALVFTVPVFIYSPMGGMFALPTPPFGLPRNVWLFLPASAAVLYPVWPFPVAAWRAVKNGVGANDADMKPGRLP